MMYTANELMLIIGAIGAVLLALGKLYVDNSATKQELLHAVAKQALDRAEKDIVELKILPLKDQEKIIKLENTITELHAVIKDLTSRLADTEAELQDYAQQLESKVPPVIIRYKKSG